MPMLKPWFGLGHTFPFLLHGSGITSIWRLEQLVLAVNDLMESRIDANLKIVANVLLVNLPEVPFWGNMGNLGVRFQVPSSGTPQNFISTARSKSS